MKHCFVVCLLVALANSSGAQDKISLKQYCPFAVGQYRATCFAYATTYSDGFVASKIKRDKSLTGRMFNKCGKYATSEKALIVLRETGTVLKSDFSEGCKASGVKKYLNAAAQYRIKGYTIIGNNETNDTEHIRLIKSALKDSVPVILAIYQEGFFAANKQNTMSFPDGYEKHSTNANHVICLLGYDDDVNEGSFLVKNNYTSWGNGGFSYVRYEDMIKLVRESYRIVL